MEEPPKLSGFGGLLRLMHYLYLITRDDGEQYVGVTNNIKRRMWQHKNGYGSSYLKDKNFCYEILLEGSESFIYSKEPEYISKLSTSLNKSPGGYNIAPSFGESNGRALLKEKEIIEIVNRINKGETQESIAKDYGVDRSQISNIATGKTWSHLNLNISPLNKRVAPLTEAIKNKIIYLAKEGVSISEIAKVLNLKYGTVYAYARHFNKNNNTKKLKPEIINKIIELRNTTNLSWEKIAKELSIGSTTARRYYKKYENSVSG